MTENALDFQQNFQPLLAYLSRFKMLLVAIDRKQTNCVLGDNFPYTLFTVNGKKPDFKMTQLIHKTMVKNVANND